jgi:hypothetical protein
MNLTNKSCAPIMCRWLPLYKNHAIPQGKNPSYPNHDHPMKFYPNPSFKSPKTLCVYAHTATELLSSLCTTSSCGWKLGLVHSRPPQLIYASVLILLGPMPHTLLYLNNVQLSNPMKTLSHQLDIHTNPSCSCQSTRAAPITTHHDKPLEVHPQGWKPSTQHIVVIQALHQSTKTPNLPNHRAIIVHNSLSGQSTPCLKLETI